MSDSQTQPYQPTPSDNVPSRRKFPLTGLLVVLLAGAVLAAAIWYAGGIDALSRLTTSLGSLSGGSPSPAQVQPATSAPASASVTASETSSLPAEAQQRMFAEQVESRQALSELVAGSITSFDAGSVHKSESSATVPLTANFKNGTSVSGTIALKRFGDKWYFFSLQRSATSDLSRPSDPTPSGFDSNIVATITEQQATAGTQEVLTKGLLNGGYRNVAVDDVTMGPQTATVDVTMSGGTEPTAKGRLVAISKIDGDTTYWFVARFEKR